MATQSTTINITFDYMEEVVRFYFNNTSFRNKYDSIIEFQEDMKIHGLTWKHNYINVCELSKYELPTHMMGLCSLYMQCDCCDIKCKMPVINAMLNLENNDEYMDNIILPILEFEFVGLNMIEELFELDLSYDIMVMLIEKYDIDLSIIIYYAFRKRLSDLVTYVLEKSCFDMDKKNDFTNVY